MGENSKIGWTDHTFNPWIGCQKVSPGCANCYAKRDWDHRRHVAKWGPMGTRILTSEANWRKPLKWDREAANTGNRPKVFCASLADMFEDWNGLLKYFNSEYLNYCKNCDEITDGPSCPRCENFDIPWLKMADIRRRMFQLIDATPNLDWLLVTKRPDNIRRMWKPKEWKSQLEADSINETGYLHRPNIWLIASVENQAAADERIPELLGCRELVPILGLSCEPLLEHIEFSDVSKRSDAIQQLGKPALSGIDWVIGGGESGPDSGPNARREMDMSAMESLHRQCEQAGVAFFCKQDSGRKEGQQGRIPDHIWNTKQFPSSSSP